MKTSAESWSSPFHLGAISYSVPSQLFSVTTLKKKESHNCERRLTATKLVTEGLKAVSKSELLHKQLILKVRELVPQLCPTLETPQAVASPGSSVHGILQAKILEWVAIPFSRGFFWSRDQTQVSCNAGRFFTVWTTREFWDNQQKQLTLTVYIFFLK